MHVFIVLRIVQINFSLTSDSYEAALDRIEKLAYTSNVDTNCESNVEEPPSKRKRIPARKISSSDEDDDSEEDASNRSPLHKKPVAVNNRQPVTPSLAANSTPASQHKEQDRQRTPQQLFPPLLVLPPSPGSLSNSQNRQRTSRQHSPESPSLPSSPTPQSNSSDSNLATVVAALGTRLSGI